MDKGSDDEVTLSTPIETSFSHGGGVSLLLRNITWGGGCQRLFEYHTNSLELLRGIGV